MSNIYNTSQQINQANIAQGDTIPYDTNLMNVRTGRIPGNSVVLMRSYRDNINNAGFFTNSGAIPVNSLDITIPTATTTLTLASSNANDTLAGTGARVVLIKGLDSNYDEIQETVNMNGTTITTATSKSFLRINEMSVISVGSGGVNVGNIFCSDNNEVYTGGTDGTGTPTLLVHSTIQATWNIANNGIFTVPRGFTFEIANYIINTDAVESRLCGLQIKQSNNGDPKRIIASQFFSGAATYELKGFQTLPEKTDIQITTNANGNYIIDAMTVWFQFLKRTL